MKLSRLILAATLLVLINSLSASGIITVITVNTLVDEDGENPDACSLREAIKANNDVLPYGGCQPADRYITNTIQLPKGRIILTHGALVPTRPVKINGADPDDHDAINPFNYLTKTKLALPVTTLDGNGNRLFRTTGADASLDLSYLKIMNGKGDLGGAILAGGTVSTTRSQFIANSASVAGGAVYLSGPNSALTINTTEFSGNLAPVSAVIGMTCQDNLNYTVRTLDFTAASFINNGDGTSQSILESCGNTILDIKNSTFGENPLSAVVNGKKAGILRVADTVGPGNSISLTQVTAVKNGSATAPAPFLLFNSAAKLRINQSAIAFNAGGGCITTTPGQTVDADGSFNTLENCQIPALLTANKSSNDITGQNVSFDSEFLPADYYGGVVRGYLPQRNSKYIVDKGPVDSSCLESVDQRGSIRNNSMTCDIGAVELRQLLSTNDESFKNLAQAGRIAIGEILSNDVADETVSNGKWVMGSLNDDAPSWPLASDALTTGVINRPDHQYKLLISPATTQTNCVALDTSGIIYGLLNRAITQYNTEKDPAIKTALTTALLDLRKYADKADSATKIDDLLSRAAASTDPLVIAKLSQTKTLLLGSKIDIDGINALIALSKALIDAYNTDRDAKESALQAAVLANNLTVARNSNLDLQNLDKKISDVLTLKRFFLSKASPMIDSIALDGMAALADALNATDSVKLSSAQDQLTQTQNAHDQAAVNTQLAIIGGLKSRIQATTDNRNLLLALKPNVAQYGDFMLLHELTYFKYADPTVLTPAGSDTTCGYKIQSQMAGNKTSKEATFHMNIANMAPTANPDTVIFPYSSLQMTIDVLANDDDNGDNLFDANDKAMPGAGGFFTDGGKSLNIKIITQPKLGYLTAEASGLCPDNSSTVTNTCFHGKITYHSNNNLSPFSDSFSYEVLDRDLLASGEAKVSILNTESLEYKKLVGDHSGDGSNGGSFGVAGLLGLAGAAFVRRKFHR